MRIFGTAPKERCAALCAVRRLAQPRQPAGACAAGAAGAGRLALHCQRRVRAAAAAAGSAPLRAWTTTRWPRCTSGCARPASIGRWMRRTAPASSVPAHAAPHAGRCAAAAVPRLRAACGMARSLSPVGSAPATPKARARWRWARCGALPTALQRACMPTLQRPKLPEAWAERAVRACSTTSWRRPTTSWTICASCARRSASSPTTCTAAASRSRCRWQVVRAALQQRLDDPARGGVAGGSINFASMSSLRGLPFRVVCADRPERRRLSRRAQRPLEFDLMALQPAARRPPAAQRRARPDARPAAGRARQPVPEPHRPQRARQRAAAAVGAGGRAAGHAGAGHRRRSGIASVAGAGAPAAGGRASAAALCAARLRHRRRPAAAQLQPRAGRGAARTAWRAGTHAAPPCAPMRRLR